MSLSSCYVPERGNGAAEAKGRKEGAKGNDEAEIRHIYKIQKATTYKISQNVELGCGPTFTKQPDKEHSNIQSTLEKLLRFAQADYFLGKIIFSVQI